MKKSKSDFILESIINTYLNEQNPVGSLVLEEHLSVPASTIRVYFKKLGELGFLDKLHISGGRIPTQKAMKYYWSEFFEILLDSGFMVNIQNENFLNHICYEYEFFCMVKEEKELILKDIYNINDKFLVLDFGGSELAIRFDRELSALLVRFIGLEVKDLQKFLQSVRIESLTKKIDEMLRSLVLFRANEKIAANLNLRLSLNEVLFSFYDFVDSVEFDMFYDNQMAIKLPCTYQGKNAKILLAGSVYNDYKKIINIIKEAVWVSSKKKN